MGRVAYEEKSYECNHYGIGARKTPEGRARNRRVEIKIYNSYNSDFN